MVYLLDALSRGQLPKPYSHEGETAVAWFESILCHNENSAISWNFEKAESQSSALLQKIAIAVHVL